MPGTTNSRHLSEDMGSRPRRLARLVAAGVSLKYPTKITPQIERDDGICAQTLIDRVASDFCDHTRRLVRCVGADCQGRQDAGVAVAALRLTQLGAAVGRSRRTCAGVGVSSSVRAQQDQYVPSVSSNSRKDLARENAHARPKRVWRRLHYNPNATLSLRRLVPAHDYPLVLRQRTLPPSHRVQAERERRRSRYITWNAFLPLLFKLVPKGGGQVDQVG
ncbi:hypothetical protein EDB89DRAFT_1910884 [Lactarius sanguifluus]|nr:hypothetical protein EDB89DRAFT_1910884 [Lactarius sanguifluus]